MTFWITLVALGVLVFLIWNLYRRFGADRLAALSEKRRPGSRLISRGEFVDGNRRMEVALALTRSTFFYENADMAASLELQWISEIVYDTQLVTGLAVGDGKVLRLRCYGQVFEFVLANDVVQQWHMNLPPRRADGVASPVTPATVPVMGA
jgi:hypothetical protein